MKGLRYFLRSKDRLNISSAAISGIKKPRVWRRQLGWTLKQRRTRSGHHKEGNLKLRWSAGGDCIADFRLHIWISILITLQLNSYITFLHLTNHLQSCSHMMMMISRSVVLAKQMLSSNAGDSLLKSNLTQVKEIQLLEIHIWGRLDLGNWSLPAAQSDGNSEFTINKIPPCSMFTIVVTTMGVKVEDGLTRITTIHHPWPASSGWRWRFNEVLSVAVPMDPSHHLHRPIFHFPQVSKQLLKTKKRDVMGIFTAWPTTSPHYLVQIFLGAVQ